MTNTKNQIYNLIRTDVKGTKFFTYSYGESDVTESSGVKGKTLRERVVKRKSNVSTQIFCRNLVRKKLEDGFVISPPDDPNVGDMVAAFYAPNSSVAHDFDIHPNGKTIALAFQNLKAEGGGICLIDIATGDQKNIVEFTYSKKTRDQTFFSGLYFNEDGQKLVYARNKETHCLDINTGKTATIASYDHKTSSQFNSYVLRLTASRDRSRFLAFNKGHHAEVVTSRGDVLMKIAIDPKKRVCCSGSISRSGHNVAILCRSHDVDFETQPFVLEVWDVEKKKIVQQIELPKSIESVDCIEFDFSAQHVLVSHGNAYETAAYSVETGKKAWKIDWQDSPGRGHYTADYSEDGRTWIVGGRKGLALLESSKRKFKQIPPNILEDQCINRIAVWRDGSLFASGGDLGAIVVRKLL